MAQNIEQGKQLARTLLRAAAQNRGQRTWQCPACGRFISLKDSQCPYCDKEVIENSKRLAELVTGKLIEAANNIEDPFPPQEYSNYLGSKKADGLIGCWKRRDALKVAKTLRTDGFKVTVRGRGKRPKRMRHRYRDSLPLRYASHAAVYIRDAELVEVDGVRLKQELPRRLRDGQVQGLLDNL